MNHPNHTWTHCGFQVTTTSGNTYRPYLAAEGVWRAQEDHVRMPTGERPQFEHLHDLVAFLDEFEGAQ